MQRPDSVERRPWEETGALRIGHGDSDSTSIAARLRGTGRATLDEIAASTGQSRLETVKALAELSAEGIIRLTYGLSRRITGIRVAGRLEIVDGEDRYVALFLEPPWEPLDGERRRYLDTFLAGLDGSLSLGSVGLICGAARIGGGSGNGSMLSFTSDQIEDYLGMPRGSMR